MRKTKVIFSPRRHSGGGFVSDDLSTHKLCAELRAVLAQWVKQPSKAEPEFSFAINEYEMVEREKSVLGRKAEERSDLQNLDEAIAEVQKRLRHFPERAAASAYAAMRKRGIDMEDVLKRVERDLVVLRAGITLAMPAKKLPPGKKTQQSENRHTFERQLSAMLAEYGRKGMPDAATMAGDVIAILNK